jgi:glycosyltransferase involved in cell wall biosynthesis/2-polyprenyl-3-methyl-5-hydroxy-6-metoxy-1,4-benzoquinol methylase
MNNDWQKDYEVRSELSEAELGENHSFTKMLRFVGNHKRVVDFGCATGDLARFLNKRGCQVVGVEINAEAAKIAERYCEKVIVADLDFVAPTEILPEQSFDVAVFGDVLEHLRDPWKVLKEIQTLLKPEGYVVVSIPNIAHGAIRLAMLHGKFEYSELGILDNTHLRFFTRKTVEELLEQSGYVVDTVDRTVVPVFSGSNLVPSLNPSEFDPELIQQIEQDEDASTLQFILRAFPVSLSGQLAVLTGKNARLTLELEQKQSQIRQAELQLQQLQEHHQVQLQQVQTQLHESNMHLQQVQAQLEQTQSAIQHQQAELENLHSQLYQAQVELGQVHSDLHQHQIQLSQTHSELERSQSELERSQSELERSQSKNRRQQAELEQLQTQLLAAQQHSSATQEQMAQVQQRLQETEGKLQESRLQTQTKQENLQSLRVKLQNKQFVLQQYRDRLAAMESSKFWKLRRGWAKFKRLLGSQEDLNWAPVLTRPDLAVSSTQDKPNPGKRKERKERSNLQAAQPEEPAKSALIEVAVLPQPIPEALEHTTESLLSPPEPIAPTPTTLDPVFEDETPYDCWLKHNTPTAADLKRMAKTVEVFAHKPLISIIMPVYNPPEQYLREAIESVLDQVYPHWEFCIADDASTKPYVKQVLEEYAALDDRIKVVYRSENGHISRCSNSALELATGEYIALLDHDDLLTPDALYEVVFLINQHPEADMIYSDEDKIDENNKLRDPFFKPDWCPDSFLSRMYTCHLGTYRRTIINQIGGFRVGYEGSQDYDLVLRFTEKTDKIFHIPKILYHWRIHAQSAASSLDAKPYAHQAAKKALDDALQRRKEEGEVVESEHSGYYVVRYKITEPKLVSIIIPTRDLGHVLNQCLESVFDKSIYPNYEVILIDNGSVEPYTTKIINNWLNREPERFRCYSLGIPFNYSKLNNYGVSKANGEYLLFLNNDTEIITSDWINAMVEQAQRPSIGAVGAMLLYPDDTVQHAGVLLGLGGVAGHGQACLPANSPGYFGQLISVNNYSALTGACLMCRRDVFELVGGFNEELAVAFNDIDLCLKILDKGYLNIYLPHVQLYHYESKSRGKDTSPEKRLRFLSEVDYMNRHWKHLIEHDPCYNPNLTLQHASYNIKEPELI